VTTLLIHRARAMDASFQTPMAASAAKECQVLQ
jgi:hypothetical protein